MRNFRLILGITALIMIGQSQALVIDDGEGHGSVKATDIASQPDCPLSFGDEFKLMDNVGVVGDGSGVYIGNGWVVTSSHVGCHPIRLRGVAYKPDTASWQILLNKHGGDSEVAVFQIADWKEFRALQELATIPIAGNSIQPGQRVIMAASGYTTSGRKETLEITEDKSSVLGHYLRPVRKIGFGFAEINKVCEDEVHTNGGMATDSLITSFGRGKGMAQATAGDSGGAVFIYNKELATWELAGCIYAVSHKSKYVPFGARTYVARLDVHHDFLVSTSLNN